MAKGNLAQLEKFINERGAGILTARNLATGTTYYHLHTRQFKVVYHKDDNLLHIQVNVPGISFDHPDYIEVTPEMAKAKKLGKMVGDFRSRDLEAAKRLVDLMVEKIRG